MISHQQAKVATACTILPTFTKKLFVKTAPDEMMAATFFWLIKIRFEHLNKHFLNLMF